MFDVSPSVLDHWDSDTPAWMPFAPRRQSAAAADALSAAARRLAIRPNASRSPARAEDRKSTRLNSSHPSSSYAVSCLKKKKPAGFPPAAHLPSHRKLAGANAAQPTLEARPTPAPPATPPAAAPPPALRSPNDPLHPPP